MTELNVRTYPHPHHVYLTGRRSTSTPDPYSITLTSPPTSIPYINSNRFISWYTRIEDPRHVTTCIDAENETGTSFA